MQKERKGGKETGEDGRMEAEKLQFQCDFCLHAPRYVELLDNGDRLTRLLNTSSLFNPLEPALLQSLRVLVSVRL